MFTTKNKISEQILRRLSGGDVSDDTEFDKREIILLVEQALAELVKEQYIKTLIVAETSVDPKYISVFKNVAIKKDTDLNLTFSESPHPYMDLHMDKGIHMVSMMKNQSDPFIPQRNGNVALYDKSPAKDMEGRIGYWPEANRIYYSRDLIKIGCDKVLIKLIVPSPSELGDDDPYPIGPDMELPIIQRVLTIMGVAVATDDVSDNTNK